jgi:uncharacterized protein (TIGR02266 family)
MANKDNQSVDDEKGAERRRHPRLAAKMDIRFKGAEDAARALRAYSINLSVGGLCLRTQKTYAVGEKVELHVRVEEEEFDLSAVVAWTRGNVAGVRFVDVSGADAARLEMIVAKLNR